MPTLIDLSGRKIGRLIVLRRVDKPSHVGKKAAYWLCKCDCGQEVIVISSGLIDYGNGRNQKSCGCLAREIAGKLRSDTADGNPAANRVYGYYKLSAKKRNIVFDLTKEEFLKLAKQRCFYCGKEPYRLSFNAIKTQSFLYNGVDRVDNSKGYIINNIVPCCTICNKAKLDLSIEEFKLWVCNIYSHFVVNNRSLAA